MTSTMYAREQYGVLSRKEYERISSNTHACASPGINNGYPDKMQERLALKAKSDERAKNWGNTIDNLREKKIKARQERFQREEEEKQQIDAEEAEFRAEQRRQQIERANKLLFQQDDRVKNFNSKILLNAVINERKQQVEDAKREQELRRQTELEFEKQFNETLHKGDSAKILELEKTREREKVVRAFQKMQLEQQVIKDQQAVEERKLTGEMLNEQAAKDTEKIKQEVEMRKRKLIEVKRDLDESVRQNQLKQKEEREKELAMESNVTDFLQKKSKQIDEGRKREEEQRKERMCLHEKHLDSFERAYKAIEDNTEAIARKQEEDYQRKQEEQERLKREKRDKFTRAVENSRTVQRQIQEEEKRREGDKKRLYREQWKAQADQMAQEEKDARKQQFARNQQVKEFQQLQEMDLERRGEVEKQRNKREVKLMKRAKKIDELRLQAHLAEVIEVEKEKGLVVDFLQTEARKLSKGRKNNALQK